MRLSPLSLASLFVIAAVQPVFAQQSEVEMRQITAQGVGEPIGTVRISGTDEGVVFTVNVRGLSPGTHGFHLHQNASCEPAEVDGQMSAGGAAGTHFDPQDTNSHQGPQGEGHAGDLPRLEVNADGTASVELRAPRLRLADLQNRSLMIHEGGDTYSDEPKDGGGGARIACGVIQ